MVRVIWASWPGRVNECIVQRLLNILDNPTFEIVRAFAEEENARRGLLGDPEVTGPDCAFKIACQEADDSRLVVCRDGTFAFSDAPRFLARITVRDTLPDPQVTAAENLSAKDTDAQLSVGQRRVTFEADRRIKTRKHRALR
jgi:hypothetical protein